jgi:hypothetical protein
MKELFDTPSTWYVLSDFPLSENTPLSCVAIHNTPLSSSVIRLVKSMQWLVVDICLAFLSSRINRMPWPDVPISTSPFFLW